MTKHYDVEFTTCTFKGRGSNVAKSECSLDQCESFSRTLWLRRCIDSGGFIFHTSGPSHRVLPFLYATLTALFTIIVVLFSFLCYVLLISIGNHINASAIKDYHNKILQAFQWVQISTGVRP